MFCFLMTLGKNVDAVEELSIRFPDVKIKARIVKYADDIAENVTGNN